MAKVFGANIYCKLCGAQPWPDDPSIRETFDLLRVEGDWLCEMHRQRENAPKERTSRIAAADEIEAEGAQ